MSFFNEMVYIKKSLTEHGITAIIPNSDSSVFQYILSMEVQSTINKYKNNESKQHIKKIRRITTRSILVINSRKKNINNYIGANTLAEIALAFVHSKKIFLLYDIPDIYHDELLAWGAIPLYGDITPIIQYTLMPTHQQLMLPGINWDEY